MAADRAHPPTHMRRLTPEDWSAFESGGSPPGLCFVLSPLLVPIEIVRDSPNHGLCVLGRTRHGGKVSPELWAEHLADDNRLADLLDLMESDPACLDHIVKLPSPFWAHGTSKLQAAKHIARVVEARIAATEAINAF